MTTAGKSRHVLRRASDPAPRTRRPEIEGLRAVACILVAVYHVYLGRVSGGVDVFFVIAGFLITTSIVGRLDRGFDAAAYVGRLARRLIPQLVVVLVATVVLVLTVLPVGRRRDSLLEVIASVLYVENWALAAKSVDYLAREAGPSPVQHFWAMSIQGQFYVLWALVAVVVLLVPSARRRLAFALVVGVLAVGSFAFSVHLTATNQELAYFHTGTRVWEFGLGGLLALVIHRVDVLPVWLRRVAGWVGLALILSCGVVLSVSDVFPGYAALWPAGAVLLVLVGSGEFRGSVRRLLGLRPLVYVGSVSYGLYLWHWPLLVVLLTHTGEGVAEPLPGLAVLVASFALAVLTTRWVERPVREGPLTTRGVLVGGAVALCAVVAFARVPMPPALSDEPVRTEGRPGPAAVADGWPDPGVVDPSTAVPALATAAQDIPELWHRECGAGPNQGRFVTCAYGPADADVTVALVGGSHAAHWFDAMRVIAEEHGFRLVVGVKSGCLLSSSPSTSDRPPSPECRSWSEDALAGLQAMRPDLLVTTGTRSDGRGSELVPPGYVDDWEALETSGVHVLALRQTPRGTVNQVECLSVEEPGECGFDRYTPIGVDPTDDAVVPDTVSFFDPLPYFCDASWCPAVIGQVVVYSDRSHMTATWSRLMAPYLEPAVVEALDRDLEDGAGGGVSTPVRDALR